MKHRAARFAGSLGLLLLAAGCVSSGNEGRPVDADQAAKANLRLGVAYLQQGNLALAKEKLERAEKQDGGNAEVHSSLGFLYERLDRKRDAERQFATARRLAPQSGEIVNTYAVFLCRNGKVDEAVREFEGAARNPLYATPWAALANAGVCLRGAKRNDEAAKYLQQAIQVRPNYAEAVTELADLQLAQGDPQAAGRTVDAFLGMGIAHPAVLLVGVRAAQARNDAAAAALMTRRLRRDFPQSPQARSLPQQLGERSPAP